MLSNFTSYQEKYLHVKDTIEEQRCEYAVCREDLNEIQDRLNSTTDEDNLDRYDQIAQDVESRDESECIKDLHPDQWSLWSVGWYWNSIDCVKQTGAADTKRVTTWQIQANGTTTK